MQQKQEEPEEKDIWTHIPTKSKRHRSLQTKTHSTLLPSPANPPLKDLTLPTLTREFQTKLSLWKQSSCRKTLLALLSRTIQLETGWTITKAVCIGSGSLSRENWECRRRSLWQFVVFYDLARFLLEDHNQEEEEEGRIYAQEPTFTILDEEFLTSLGIRVLDEKVVEGGGMGMGAAERELGERTFLFEPFVDMDVGMLESMLENGVGLYIGSSISGILERRGGSEIGELARRFVDGREMRKFPVFEIEPNVLEGLGIYWKEEGDDED